MIVKQTFGTTGAAAGTDFSKSLGEYNMPPCHVVFLFARTKGRRPKVRGGELS